MGIGGLPFWSGITKLPGLILNVWSCFFLCLNMVTYDKVSKSKFLDVVAFLLFAMQPAVHTNSSYMGAFLKEYLALSVIYGCISQRVHSGRN